MAVADVGSTSVFQSPSVGSIGPAGQTAPPSPAPVVPDNDSDDRQAQPAAPQVVNTAPSDDDRKKAEADGKTRGSFVDIRA
jgi:hypothetical protein